MLKKSRKIIISALLIVALLSGCGNKSNAELVDVEQFRCQDSIETVFDVLGETDLKALWMIDCYKYENLNLWGYNGEVVFIPRDDNETIRRFYCNLALTNKEFEDILSTFSSKYGSYTVSNENDTEKKYEWTMSDNTANPLGYNKITIKYNGEKEYTVSFSDDTSDMSDKEYKEYLEEKESESSETNLEVIAQKEYDLGNSDSMSISVFGNNGNAELSFSAQIADEEKAAFAFSYFYTLLSSEATEEFKPSISIYCNDLSVFYNNGIAMGFEKDGEAVFTLPNWVSDSLDNIDASNEELNDFLEILQDNVGDFLNLLK